MNENNKIDDYFEDDTVTKYNASQDEYSSSAYLTKRKKNIPIIVLLSCVLIVGIVIVGIQIIQPFDKHSNSTQDQITNKGNFDQRSGIENDNSEPQLHQEGYAGSGNENQLVGEMDMNGQKVLYEIVNGEAKYSADGGKTWTNTPPEGMPPLPGQ